MILFAHHLHFIILALNTSSVLSHFYFFHFLHPTHIYCHLHSPYFTFTSIPISNYLTLFSHHCEHVYSHFSIFCHYSLFYSLSCTSWIHSNAYHHNSLSSIFTVALIHPYIMQCSIRLDNNFQLFFSLQTYKLLIPTKFLMQPSDLISGSFSRVQILDN